MASRSFLRELNKNMSSPSYYQELVRALDEREAAAQDQRAIRLHPRLIAESVRHEREKRGWKQDTLAGVATVSLSTVQRIERAEPVNEDNLHRIEKAFNLSAGAYSKSRVPETMKRLKELLEKEDTLERDSERVKVSRVQTQRQILSLIKCRVLFLDVELPDEGSKADLAKLRDEIELASLVHATAETGILRAMGHCRLKRKPMYRDILDFIYVIEAKHQIAIRCGVYRARVCIHGSNTLEVAVMNVRSRKHDPASVKSGNTLAPKSLDGNALLKDFEKRMNAESAKFRQSEVHV